MGRALHHPLSHNRVHVVYDDGLAAFDLPADATLGEAAGEGHKTLNVNVALDSNCLPI
jgi:hypothetical protein